MTLGLPADPETFAKSLLNTSRLLRPHRAAMKRLRHNVRVADQYSQSLGGLGCHPGTPALP